MGKCIVYVNDHCMGCQTLVNVLENEKLVCEIVNVDRYTEKSPPGIYIYPALFNDDKLVAYGPDILPLLRSN